MVNNFYDTYDIENIELFILEHYNLLVNEKEITSWWYNNNLQKYSIEEVITLWKLYKVDQNVVEGKKLIDFMYTHNLLNYSLDEILILWRLSIK
jgi:hypothetical protein